jgi:hypothetical protein
VAVTEAIVEAVRALAAPFLYNLSRLQRRFATFPSDERSRPSRAAAVQHRTTRRRKRRIDRPADPP